MFQDRKTLPTGRQANKTNNDLGIEAIPVHTMQQDLDEIKNPGAVQIKNLEREPTVRRNPINPDNLNATQKSSPFLNPTPERETGKPEAAKTKPIQPESARMISSLESQPPLTPRKPLETAPKTPSPASKKPFFLFVATSLVLILIASGGYYFWMTRQQEDTEVVEDIPLIEPIPEPTPETIPEPVQPATFSTDKPNYLNIPAGIESELLKKTLLDYTNKVSQSGISTPVEFVISDENNNPVTFQDFAKKINLDFSPALSDNLDKNFSLYIYNDKAVTRLGLAIDFKKQTDLVGASKLQIDPKNLLLLEEEKLVEELSPLFLNANYTLPAKMFTSSNYGALTIRYINITSPDDLSVDYAILADKLLIGTTKMTMYSIIDHISAAAISQNSDIN